MPELRYLDNQLYGARMGSAFSDAVTGIMRLKLAQQQRAEEQARNLAEFRLAQERLDLDKRRDAREELIRKAAQSGADALARMYAPKGNAPTIENARAMDVQDLARARAYVQGTNPAAAGRALEPQQFSPGPVYDWNALLPGMGAPAATLPGTYGMSPVQLPGGPQPLFNVPPTEMTPYQQRVVDERGLYNQILAQRLQLMQEQADERERQFLLSLGERTRHNVATEAAAGDKADPFGIKRRIQERMGGTNAPSGNIKSIRLVE